MYKLMYTYRDSNHRVKFISHLIHDLPNFHFEEICNMSIFRYNSAKIKLFTLVE